METRCQTSETTVACSFSMEYDCEKACSFTRVISNQKITIECQWPGYVPFLALPGLVIAVITLLLLIIMLFGVNLTNVIIWPSFISQFLLFFSGLAMLCDVTDRDRRNKRPVIDDEGSGSFEGTGWLMILLYLLMLLVFGVMPTDFSWKPWRRNRAVVYEEHQDETREIEIVDIAKENPQDPSS